MSTPLAVGEENTEKRQFLIVPGRIRQFVQKVGRHLLLTKVRNNLSMVFFLKRAVAETYMDLPKVQVDGRSLGQAVNNIGGTKLVSI